MDVSAGMLHLALRHYLFSISSDPLSLTGLSGLSGSVRGSLRYMTQVGGLSVFAACNAGLILEATGGGAIRAG
jgi:hypothetical protein